MRPKAIGKTDLINVAWSWLSHTARANALQLETALKHSGCSVWPQATGFRPGPGEKQDVVTNFETKHHFSQKN